MARDPPYVDGLDKLSTSHYRARQATKEISKANFNATSVTTGTFEAFVGPRQIGSIRQAKHFEALKVLKGV